MSNKRKLLELLQQKPLEVAPIIVERSETYKTNDVRKKELKKTPHKKQHFKKSKHKSTKLSNYEQHNGISANSSVDFSYSTDNHVLTHYSDSDIEINVSNLSDSNWLDISDTNITPSKSEYNKNLEESINVDSTSLQYIDVDTICHVDNNIESFNNFWVADDGDSDNKVENVMSVANPIFNEEKTVAKSACVNCYNMKNGKILVLKDKINYCIHGSFKLTILCGNIELMGCNLAICSESVDVYSLRGFSYLSIENTHKGDYSRLDCIIEDQLTTRGVDEEDIVNILSNLEQDDTILACSVLPNFKLPYIEKHISQKLLPVDEDNIPVVVKNDIDKLNIVTNNPQWEAIVQMIDETSKLMICGGKGVGKSTLLRFLINNLLSSFTCVLVIDLDPGQPEFTVPGCISGIIISKPIFGPNFTHLQDPQRCIFVENIDVTLDPDVYIRNVVELLEQCRQLPKMPTLINYMGFCQSYGINIASTVITYVSPTIVVQINSSQNAKNFAESLTPDAVERYLDTFGDEDYENLSYKFVEIDSMSDNLTSWTAHGRSIREMCILSYFSSILDNSLSLTSRNVPLFRIPIKDITLINGSFKIEQYKLVVLNASLVSLCTSTAKPNVYNCHGWGIVRGIDEEHLVLITPVHENLLQIVTHLAVGSVTLPPSMLMHEDQNTGLVPYVSLGCVSTFNSIPKRSYLPKKAN